MLIKTKKLLNAHVNNGYIFKCNGTSPDDYNRILEANNILNESEIANKTWICNKCKIIENAQIFPFGLEHTHDLQDIILIDSMQSLDNLPSYKISSEASKFNSLKQSDIEENLVNNLNTRYYSAHTFKTLSRHQSFNIFHS